MKRKLWIILALAVLAAALCCATALADNSGSCGDNATWTFDPGTGVLTISGTGDMWDYTEPPPGWDDQDGSIIRVVIEDGITSVGGYSFRYCHNLKQITIPEGVTRIGEHSFEGCESLTEIILPDSLTSIEMAAFYWCSGLTEITIPANVTNIDIGAFFLCTGLTSVEIPASVVSLSAYSFARCENLASVTIRNPEMEIGDSDCDVFDSCAAGLVIHGWDPSTAKTYAEIAGIAFEPLSEAAAQ